VSDLIQIEEMRLPCVVGICVAPAAGMPMETRESAEARAGAGLVGDRYSEGKGAFSKVEPGKKRHVTLISLEETTMGNVWLQSKDMKPFLLVETRRNIVTCGIDLHALVGKEFSVGPVRMRGVELADPCHRPSALAKKPGFRYAFTKGGAGIRAEILNDGVIKLEDEIVVHE